jgi:hypothetical protein
MNKNQKIMTLLREAWNLFIEQSQNIEREAMPETLDRKTQQQNRMDFCHHINSLHRIVATQELITRDPEFFNHVPQTKKPERSYEATATPGLTEDQYKALNTAGLYGYWLGLIERDVFFDIWPNQDRPEKSSAKWEDMTPEDRDAWVVNLIMTS